MVKTLGKGLLGRLAAYAVLLAGFWGLFQGFLRPYIPFGVLGGVLVLAGMWLLVSVHRGSIARYRESATKTEEGNPGDSLD